MDSFNKNMKDKLSGYDNDIPEGMSWDEMGPEIIEQLPKKRRRLIPFWLFSIVGLVVFSSYYIINSIRSNESNTQGSALSEITKSKKNQSIEKNYTLSKEDIKLRDENEASVTKESEANARIISLNQSSDLSLGQSPIENPRKNVTIKQTLEVEQSASDVYSSENSAQSVVTSKVSNSPIYNKSGNDEPLRTSVNILNEEVLVPFSTLENELSKLAYELPEIEAANDQLSTVEAAVMEELFTPITSVFIGGGYSYWTWGNKVQGDKDINQYETTIGSYGLSALLDYRFSRHFGIRTGIQYKNLRSKLDHSFLLSQETKTDHTDSTHVNNILTNSSYYESPARILVTKTRRVKAYNHFHRLQIPIVGHYYNQYERMSYTIGIGVGVQYLLAINGKSIDNNGGFLDYNIDTNVKSFLGFSAIFDTQIGYSINQHTDLIFGLQLENSLTNWMKSSDPSRNPWIYSSRLGVRRNF